MDGRFSDIGDHLRARGGLPIYFEMTAAQSSTFPTGINGSYTVRFTRGGRTHTTTVNRVANCAAMIS